MGWGEDDILIAGRGNDHLDGGNGNHILKAKSVYDVIHGLSGINIFKVELVTICYSLEAIMPHSIVFVVIIFC